jgi:hypothetical protein
MGTPASSVYSCATIFNEAHHETARGGGADGAQGPLQRNRRSTGGSSPSPHLRTDAGVL